LLPPRQSILESPDLAEGKPFLQGFADDMGCAVVSNIEQPKFPEVETLLNEKLGEAMFGEISAEDAVMQAAEEGEEIIDG
jgi:ABC-type glycerol-3-phosphate transport system substrate-binding protein